MDTVLGAMSAVLFDKDGTLLDFHATWDRALGLALTQLSGGSSERLAGAAAAIGYDLEQGVIRPGSPFIAESNAEVEEHLRPWIDSDELEDALLTHAVDSAVAAPGATELLAHLSAHGVTLAVVTNDAERQARAQLDRLGWTARFGGVTGYDSGYGYKPRPGPILGAMEQLAAEPSTTLMVGDSSQDLDAGRSAGVAIAYVGPDRRLASRADVSGTTLTELLHALVADAAGPG